MLLRHSSNVSLSYRINRVDEIHQSMAGRLLQTPEYEECLLHNKFDVHPKLGLRIRETRHGIRADSTDSRPT